MTNLLPVLGTLAALLGTGPMPAPFRQEVAAATAEGLRAEYDALIEQLDVARMELDGAMGELYAGYEAAGEAERAAIEAKAQTLWRERNPSGKFAVEFRKLAERAKGHEVARDAWIRTLELAASAGSEPAHVEMARAAFAALLADWSGASELAEVAWMVLYSRPLPRAERLEWLAKLQAATQDRDVAAALCCVRALTLMDDEATADDKAKARAQFAELAAKFGDVWSQNGGKYGELAEANLYELEHLQIGMVAPDFEARDSSGAAFKLSDYRGKVVVIDFWGFW